MTDKAREAAWLYEIIDGDGIPVFVDIMIGHEGIIYPDTEEGRLRLALYRYWLREGRNHRDETTNDFDLWLEKYKHTCVALHHIIQSQSARIAELERQKACDEHAISVLESDRIAMKSKIDNLYYEIQMLKKMHPPIHEVVDRRGHFDEIRNPSSIELVDKGYVIFID